MTALGGNEQDVMIRLLFDFDHPKTTFEEFLLEQEKIIVNTLAVDSQSTLITVDELMDKYINNSPSNSGLPSRYTSNSPELQSFLSCLSNVASFDTNNATASEIGTILIDATSVEKDLKSTATTNAATTPVVNAAVAAAIGRGSKGKSTTISTFIGHDVTFAATGESTKLLIEYYIHSIPANEQPRFYIDAMDDSDPATQLADAADMKRIVTDRNLALPTIDATVPPLRCAIYTNQANFYGLLIDTPGIRATTAAGSAVNNDSAVCDMIETVLNTSSDESTFIINEAISTTFGANATSFEPIAEEMKNRGLLLGFLQRSVVIVNQANFCETLQPAQIPAFQQCVEELLAVINSYCLDAGVSPLKPIFVGLQVINSVPAPWSAAEDHRIAGIVAPLIQPFSNSVSLGGLGKLRTILLDRQMIAASTLLTKVKRSVKEFYIRNNKSSRSQELPLIFTALKNAEDRLFRMLETYMSSKDPDTSSTAKYFISIDHDEEPQLHTYLARLFDQDLRLLHRSKYSINGTIITDKNIEQLLNDSIDLLDPNCELRREPLNRNGCDEVQQIAIKIAAFFVSIELAEFDEVRFSQQKTRAIDVALMGSNFKSGVDGIMVDDIRTITEVVFEYLTDTLKWLFPKIIDASLLLEKLFPPNPQATALDYVNSLLEVRHRAKEAVNFLTAEILILLNNNLDKGNAVRPEEAKCVGVSFRSLLSRFYDRFGVSNDPPTPKVDRGQRILTSFFGDSDPIDHKLTKAEDRLEYAKDLFEIQVTYILQEVNNVFKREFVPFATRQTSQRACFRLIFRSFLYHNIARPFLHYVTDCASMDRVNVIQPSKYPFAVQAESSDEQEKDLITAYEWGNQTGTAYQSSTGNLIEAITNLTRTDPFVRRIVVG